MTVGKVSALTLSLIGALALGIWIGHAAWRPSAPHAALGTPPAVTAHAERARAARRAPRADEHAPSTVPVSNPELHARLKPLLNRGTNMTAAADGFDDAGEFAAVAHAAQNTDVPFVVLKHRVLDEKKTLAAAIHESKPDLNARVEADRAWAEARSDLAQLAS